MEPINNTQAIAAPLYAAKGWMKFLGVLSIIWGVITALSIIGLLIAWLPIWIGVLLFQSASAVERAYNTSDEESLITSLGKLRTYFTIAGVLALLSLAFAVFGMFMGGLAGFAGFNMEGM